MRTLVESGVGIANLDCDTALEFLTMRARPDPCYRLNCSGLSVVNMARAAYVDFGLFWEERPRDTRRHQFLFRQTHQSLQEPFLNHVAIQCLHESGAIQNCGGAKGGIKVVMNDAMGKSLSLGNRAECPPR